MNAPESQAPQEGSGDLMYSEQGLYRLLETDEVQNGAYRTLKIFGQHLDFRQKNSTREMRPFRRGQLT